MTARELQAGFIESVQQRMEVMKISRMDLARAMDCSSAYVTKLMRGKQNVTIETMVKLAHALQFHLEIEFTPCEVPALETGADQMAEKGSKKGKSG